MLMLERFDGSKLELAALLDESPYANFIPSKTCGEPWRADGPLVKAVASADLEGYAWLYVVYNRDEYITWGSRMVKVMAGGEILRKEMTSSGIWTGEYVALRYEVIRRDLFHNIVGEDTLHRFAVVETAVMRVRNSETGSVKSEEPSNDLFGDADMQAEPKRDSLGYAFPRTDIECFHIVRETNDEPKEWHENDGDWAIYRLLLTEYQRRPFVQKVLGILGFVKEDGVRAAPLNDVCSGVMNACVSSIETVAKLQSSRMYPPPADD